MIARLWRGWTTRENADAYEALLRARVLPGIHRVPGYRGAYLLRRDVKEGVEFATITHFDGIDSIRAFAGDDLTLAVVPPEARALLSRWDERSTHYDVVQGPE